MIRQILRKGRKKRWQIQFREKIAFENADAAVEFVNRVQQIPFDVDLKAKKYEN